MYLWLKKSDLQEQQENKADKVGKKNYLWVQNVHTVWYSNPAYFNIIIIITYIVFICDCESI